MEALRNPIGMRQTTRGESLHLPLYVILHASDRWTKPIQQQVGGAVIALVRKTNAAGVGDKPFSNLWAWNAPNVGAMDMTIDGNRLAPAIRKPIPAQHRSPQMSELAKDSRDWCAPTPSDLESERAQARAATRSSLPPVKKYHVHAQWRSVHRHP